MYVQQYVALQHLCNFISLVKLNPKPDSRHHNFANKSYIKIQQDITVYQNLLFHIYMKLNMFRATHRPSSGT